VGPIQDIMSADVMPPSPPLLWPPPPPLQLASQIFLWACLSSGPWTVALLLFLAMPHRCLLKGTS
jgi:hypothetical protein